MKENVDTKIVTHMATRTSTINLTIYITSSKTTHLISYHANNKYLRFVNFYTQTSYNCTSLHRNYSPTSYKHLPFLYANPSTTQTSHSLSKSAKYLHTHTLVPEKSNPPRPLDPSPRHPARILSSSLNITHHLA